MARVSGGEVKRKPTHVIRLAMNDRAPRSETGPPGGMAARRGAFGPRGPNAPITDVKRYKQPLARIRAE